VIGAHYDSVIGSPGADDNATGVAVLLELARLLKPVELNYTIRKRKRLHQVRPHQKKAC
jgi:aminopeptidase YwaD